MSEYESYDDDFDGGDIDIDTSNDMGVPESAQENATDRSVSEVEAVMDILQGGDGKGYKAKPNDSGMRSRDLDANGNPDYSRGGTSTETAQEAPIGSATIYSQEVKGEMQDLAQQWDQVNANNRRADEMLRNGDITPEQHHQITFELGQHAGAMQRRAYELRIMELEHGAQLDAQHKELESLGEDFSPDRRTDTMKAMVDFARENGIGDDVLRGVETKDEAKFIYDAMKNAQKVKELELRLAGKSQKLREANRALGKGRRTGQRASQTGAVDKQSAMIDQVAALLRGEG